MRIQRQGLLVAVASVALASAWSGAGAKEGASAPKEIREIRLPAPPGTPPYDTGAGVTLPEMFGLARGQGAERHAACGPRGQVPCGAGGKGRGRKAGGGKEPKASR